MESTEERVHDADEWRVEATAVIKDIGDNVLEMSISSLPASDQTIYFNLKTKENKTYCIELTISGYRIVSEKYNDNSAPTDTFYETPYALLDNISPKYRESFCVALANKLSALVPIEEDESDVDE
ncbi:unnamed protein product [Meganyctiphanes norvegica]|uniref:GSKIP domain-containing protein n=1 Tax=Meganyctiphanes norvegica TaxID=48144 RepID=A0AAV2QCW4_MEGNR